jgi:putative membrane protein
MKAILLAITAFVFVWSVIHPHDYFTWALEVTPAIIALPILLLTHKKFPLTPLLYILITFHACILMVGGHYTYALAPVGDWIKTALSLDRNPYDRIGHFFQGFIPALIIRELLLRTSPLKSGKWLFAIIVFACLGIAASYELLEWMAAATTGDAADAFLGTQGDVWDTQKDMALADIGAVAALITLSNLHDKQLLQLPK